MKIGKTIKKIGAYVLLIILLAFNFYLYRAEFAVSSDVNDNNFHAGLILEAEKIWQEIFAKRLSIFYLFDSFNERWSEGFPLSLYYSHIPQAAIAFFSFVIPVSPERLFIIIRTLFLILLPASFFVSALILDFPLLFALALAFFSQVIFTDGLYGIDVSSFLFRGWGISAQLFAVFFLPIAFAYGTSYLKSGKNLTKAIIFNFIVAQGHFGIFYLLLLAYPPLFIFYIGEAKVFIKRILSFFAILLLFLSYFIIPFFLYGEFRNFSFWDSWWKFNSYGANQVIVWFLNGNLFDFGRFSTITLAAIFGFFLSFLQKDKRLKFFASLFFLYTALFFGRETWGRLIDLIPGFSEFHLHRLIVMVQFSGLFLAAYFFYFLFLTGKRLVANFQGEIKILAATLGVAFVSLLVFFLEKPIVKYAKDNEAMIKEANETLKEEFPSYQKIREKLESAARSRIYAGRPGDWGRNFTVGGTPLYMALSKDGFSVVGQAPESWSLNSEYDQFFSETNYDFFNLYNVSSLVIPDDFTPPEFANLVVKEGRYSLYQIKTDGWFTLGKSSLLVKSGKKHLTNIIHLWLSADLIKKSQYPAIEIGNVGVGGDFSKIITMTGLNSYQQGGKENSLWSKNLLSEEDFGSSELVWQKIAEQSGNGRYQIKFDLKKDCQGCVLVLRQTYHPNWQITVKGEKKDAFPVFPFYIGIPIGKAGFYDVEAIYQPSLVKVILIIVESMVLFWIVIKKLSPKKI